MVLWVIQSLLLTTTLWSDSSVVLCWCSDIQFAVVDGFSHLPFTRLVFNCGYLMMMIFYRPTATPSRPLQRDGLNVIIGWKGKNAMILPSLSLSLRLVKEFTIMCGIYRSRWWIAAQKRRLCHKHVLISYFAWFRKIGSPLTIRFQISSLRFFDLLRLFLFFP